MRRLQHPIGPELLSEIGDVTVSTALLESTLQRLAESLLGSGQRIGEIVTCELSFHRLLDVTRSLYLEREGKGAGVEELDQLLKRAEDLYARRNAVTHSIWAAGHDGYAATRIKLTARRSVGLSAAFEKIKPGQISSLARQMQELASEVQDFWIQHTDSKSR